MENRYGFGKSVALGFDQALAMGQMTDNPDVGSIGAEVREKLQRVMRAL